MRPNGTTTPVTPHRHPVRLSAELTVHTSIQLSIMSIQIHLVEGKGYSHRTTKMFSTIGTLIVCRLG
jgi:hypothetical protein